MISNGLLSLRIFDLDEEFYYNVYAEHQLEKGVYDKNTYHFMIAFLLSNDSEIEKKADKVAGCLEELPGF